MRAEGEPDFFGLNGRYQRGKRSKPTFPEKIKTQIAIFSGDFPRSESQKNTPDDFPGFQTLRGGFLFSIPR